jgi:hypothetical protein
MKKKFQQHGISQQYMDYGMEKKINQKPNTRTRGREISILYQ